MCVHAVQWAPAEAGSSVGGVRRVGERHTATKRGKETMDGMTSLYGSLALSEDPGAVGRGAGAGSVGGGTGRGPFSSTGRTGGGGAEFGASASAGADDLNSGSGGAGGSEEVGSRAAEEGPASTSPAASLSPVRIDDTGEGEGDGERADEEAGAGGSLSAGTQGQSGHGVPPIEWGDVGGPGGADGTHETHVPQRVLDMITPRDPAPVVEGPPEDADDGTKNEGDVKSGSVDA